MAAITLKALLRSGLGSALDSWAASIPAPIGLQDSEGRLLYGASGEAATALEDLGQLLAPPEHAPALARFIETWKAKEQERRALASEVLHLYREVSLFEQLSTELASVLDIQTVAESALAQARRLISAEGGAVFLDGEQVASFGESDALDAVAAATVEKGVAEVGESVLAAPLRLKQSTIGAIVLAGHAYSSVELKLLNTIALQCSVAIENARALRDREQLAAIRQELDTARQIQHSLVPRKFPPFPERQDFDLHASMTSAKAVGGDFFDFFLIDEHRLGIVLGDVSGKGVPSALFMAVTITQIKTAALEGVPPERCLQTVNKALVRDKASSMFATCFYGILDLRNGQFDYCNAGHNPPYLLSAAGEVTPLALTGGIPLGLFDMIPYTALRIQLSPGDALFVYTDGVPEASDASDAEFTDELLIATLAANKHLNSPALLEEVYGQVLAFTKGAPQSDDITMLALRWRP